MDNPKVEIRKTNNLGKGLFAKEDIKKGEVIADWTGGEIFEVNKASNLPDKVKNHAIQFDEHKWIDYDGIGRYFNHSCEPNCGFKGKFQVISMRDIKKGEWLTWDYEMTEDSDWKIDCLCGNKNCRKIVGSFKNMPDKTRKKYKGYISDWLVKKYKL